jgi:hypothetical protein
LKEKYFAAFFTESGQLEGVYWYRSEKAAKLRAAKWKKRFPDDAKNVVVGELLIEPMESA